MLKDISAIVIATFVVGLIGTIFRSDIRRRAMGLVGLILVLVPVALQQVRGVDSWLVAVCTVAGLVLALLSTRD